MQITEDALRQVSTLHDLGEWVDAFNEALPKYFIDSTLRAAMFLAQAAHETGGFIHLRENLNYSAQGLLATFPKHFTAEEANFYARNSKGIGNHAYANRNGNGDEASGDGYNYRGGGFFQLTGKGNYAAFSQAAYGDDRMVTNPETIVQPDVAIESACWFWNINNLSTVADRADVLKVTKVINGGTNGLDERKLFYRRLMNCL